MENLEKIAKLIRYFILVSTTEAGSGHVTSSLSATDLMTVLLFDGFFKFDVKNPQNPNNDRLIFSKGHASPLFYSLFAAAGAITETELKTLRKFGSRLEGHPTMLFPFTEAPTGSLGQGLSIGLGMALSAKYLDKLPFKTYVLLGDSEMAEGSVWEAIQLAAHYQLDNLIGILDVNRLGQRGQTMYGHNIKDYEKRIAAFGWQTIAIDGHSLKEIRGAFKKAQGMKGVPIMIIAKTLKGKGISFLEDKDDWHGKALKPEELEKALAELGPIDKKLTGKITMPPKFKDQKLKAKVSTQDSKTNYQLGENIATRKAYGNALVRIYPQFPNLVVLDAEVSNSTFADIFKKAYPERFFEMYIAEQNMVGTALGLARQDKIPFVSTFAAFFSRAFDQIRMSQYADTNIKFIGSHAGVSIGEDGASQMGLEDIAIFRSLLNSVILYPSDAVSTEKLLTEAAKHKGNVYIRTTRKDTPILYPNNEQFPIGGSKILKSSNKDLVTVIGAGITLHEALAAYEQLAKENILIRVIDLYSIKPLDIKTLVKASQETQAIITVEDHFEQGGIGEAVSSTLSGHKTKVYSLAVRKMPRSGKPAELLEYEEISASAIIQKVKEIIAF
ncbi:transketolase [Candidatus Daviesbacteria bacterium]|nr:transketolase [Candidatus Daviesbacteria bacterium]